MNQRIYYLLLIYQNSILSDDYYLSINENCLLFLILDKFNFIMKPKIIFK